MTDPGPLPAPEIDFLTALSPRGLLLVVVGALVGGLLGFAAGQTFLHHHEARAVLRIATIGMFGPAVPLSEVKARAESRSIVIEALTAAGAPDPAGLSSRYKVSAELDGSHDGTVVVLAAQGPEADLVLKVTQHVQDVLVKRSHDAYSMGVAEKQVRLDQASQAIAAFQKAAETRTPSTEVPGQISASMEFMRWAGEMSNMRGRADRELVESRDTEIIDPPYARDTLSRPLLLAALGAFAGLLVGLSLSAWLVRR
jgi:hypothetical protein